MVHYWGSFLLSQIFFSDAVHVNGFGASFPQAVYNEWTSTYMAKRKPFVNLHMKYIDTGSGNGIKLMTGSLMQFMNHNQKLP